MQQFNGKAITDLMDLVEKQVCGECYGYGEIAQEQGWPTFDYKMVPCQCPAGERLAAEQTEAEQAETVGPNFWRGIAFGILLTSPLWLLLAWDWCHGMVR